MGALTGEPWRPLLKGKAKQRAEESVAAIAADLADPSAVQLPDPSLARGKAGVALMHAYLAQSRSGSGHEAAARRFLADAVDAPAPARKRDASLYVGSTGIAWTSAHLRRLLAEPVADAGAGVDAALLVRLARWEGEYELVYGLAGIGVYALERLPDPSALRLLQRVVGLLAERAEWTSEGATWHTPPESDLVAEDAWPRGFYNLGVAHGVAGVIGFLAGVVAADVGDARAERLLEGATAWLLAQEERPENSATRFAPWLVPEGEPPPPPRTAWCYGDAGIAAALMSAARATANAGWERKAIELAHAAAQRSQDQARVVDAGLCHGSAGLGHLFNRLFQATRDERLADAARLWLDRAVAMREPGVAVGGFTAVVLRNGEQVRGTARGFLIGAAGVALALLAATTPVAPGWDRCLAVST